MKIEDFEKESLKYINFLGSQNVSENTLRNYSGVFKCFSDYLKTAIDEKKGSASESEIGSRLIYNFSSFLFDSGEKSSNTVRHYLAIIKAFFEHLISAGIEDKNPVEKKLLPKEKEIKRDLLSRDEIQKLLTCDPKKMHRKNAIRNKAIIMLLIQCGMRNSELRSLYLSDLDFETCTIKIRHGKGDKERYLPFPEMSMRVTQEYLASGQRPECLHKDGYLFGTFSESKNEWMQISSRNLLEMVSEYVYKTTGHPGIGVHDLRHAAASLWDDLGVSMRSIQGALGHSSIQTTEKIYVSVLNKKRAAASVNEAFRNAI